MTSSICTFTQVMKLCTLSASGFEWFLGVARQLQSNRCLKVVASSYYEVLSVSNGFLGGSMLLIWSFRCF